MSTNSISSSTDALTAAAVIGRNGGHHRAGLLQTAAQTLGLSVDDLVDELRSGKSLDDVATAQGVSHDDLAAAIKAGMPARMAGSTGGDAILDAVLARKGMPERPQLPPPVAAPVTSSPVSGATGSAARGTTGSTAGGTTGSTSSTSVSGVFGTSLTDSQQATLTALSSLLDTDPDSLMSDLQGGTSLSDLLSAKDVDQNTLAAILQDGLLFDATV